MKAENSNETSTVSNDQLDEVYQLIRDLTEKFAEGQVAVLAQISEIKVAVARIEERDKTRQVCPSPGLCIKIEDKTNKRLDDLEEWQQKIEKEKAEARGSVKTALWLVGVSGPVIGVVASFLAKKLGILP